MPSRKPHRKSRNGCTECKRRRVKCNEQHPCQNCLKYDSQCVYNDVYFPQRKSPMEPTHPPLLPPLPGPSSILAGIEQAAPAPGMPTSPEQKSTWIRDLELMHHFTAVVSKTLSGRREVQDVWGIVMPQMAFSCDYLMHGILALSALHLATLKVQNKNHYIDCSMSHLQCSLTTYNQVLPNISADNCETLVAISSLLTVHVCALPIVDEAGPYLERITTLFSMCRGVETILSPYTSLVQQGPLKPLLQDDYRVNPDSESVLPSSHVNVIFPEDLEDRLSRLKELVAHYPLEHFERTTYFEALSHLEISFDYVQKASLPLECGMAFTWPIMSPREFVAFLQDSKPLSLVFLSYYCTILNRLHDFWFLRGWDKMLLSEIWSRTPLDLRPWIEWPIFVCGVER